MDSHKHITIINLMKTSLAKQTVLHALHRLEGVFEFDRVIVMHDGKVVEEGQPRQLYQENTFFRDLYDSEENSHGQV